MRKHAPLILAIAAVIGAALPARAVPPAAAGALASSNVDLVATIPDAGAIGGRILGDTLYMTTVTGLRIYDVSQGIPVLQGALPLPHFENENLTVADRPDGTRVALITADLLVGFPNELFVIDVTNAHTPTLTGVVNTPTGHTVACIQGCTYAWSTGSGPGITVVDLSNLAAPVSLGTIDAAGGGHNVNVDQSGIAWVSGWSGLFAFDVRPGAYGASNALSPTLIASQRGGCPMPCFHNDFIIHGSLRPDANATTPATLADGKVDPGELVLVTEENWSSNNTPVTGGNGMCKDDGEFQTAWFHTVGGAYRIDNIDRFHLGQGTITDAKKPFAAIACSSHWFDYHAGVVADAWYEQGARFLDVSDPYHIKQIGYYMPADTEVWMTLYHEVRGGPLPGLYVYTLDLARGMDVLTFSGKAGDAPQLAPRYNVTGFAGIPSPQWGWACRIPVARAAIAA